MGRGGGEACSYEPWKPGHTHPVNCRSWWRQRRPASSRSASAACRRARPITRPPGSWMITRRGHLATRRGATCVATATRSFHTLAQKRSPIPAAPQNVRGHRTCPTSCCLPLMRVITTTWMRQLRLPQNSAWRCSRGGKGTGHTGPAYWACTLVPALATQAMGLILCLKPGG